MDFIFLIGRILFGLMFLIWGTNHFMKMQFMSQYAASKRVPMPTLATAAAGVLLLVGGVGILLGAYVEWAVLALVLFFVPTSLMMHNFWAIADSQIKMQERVNFMKNMAIMGATLMLLAIPTPWAFSVF